MSDYNKCRKHDVPFTLVQADRGKTVQVCHECEKEKREIIAKIFGKRVSHD